MARQIEPMAGDEVRFRKGRHTHTATFIRPSARGARSHVFADGQHTTIPTVRISHILAKSAKDRAEALNEPMSVAEVMMKNLGTHELADDARETHEVVKTERDHALAAHGIIHLAYHGHEADSRKLADDLEDGKDPALVAASAEKLLASIEPKAEAPAEEPSVAGA
jgi:hypothetical protein